MKKLGISVFGLLISMLVWGQEEGAEANSSTLMLNSKEKLTIGGYGQFDYNQPIEQGTMRNGVLDIHRMVLMFGYKFGEKTSFISEIEIEHVKEVFVEQAFVNYQVQPWLNIRGGLMLIPMGIINEYHEPPTFNGVERPNLDKYIVPTTWREIGIGVNGRFIQSGIGYQLYMVNGFLGHNDGDAKLGGSSLFRSGRQKGAESVFTSPNLTFRADYTGVPGLNVGLSGYFGDTQSTMMNGVDRNSQTQLASADSTTVGIAMIGFDARYAFKGIGIKAQLTTGTVSNSDQYNDFHGTDLGSEFLGYYGEISYNLFHSFDFTDTELTPFFRYENYNTHKSVEGSIVQDPSFNRTDLTFGIGWKPDMGLIYKIDYQVFKNEASSITKNQINAGIGVWF